MHFERQAINTGIEGTPGLPRDMTGGGKISTTQCYYADLNEQVLGYEPPAIMLLHVNRLNADAMKGILSLFEESGYDFITLEKEQADAAYRQLPSYATKYGPMWGYRWAKDRNVRIDGSLEREPPEWIVSYGE